MAIALDAAVEHVLQHGNAMRTIIFNTIKFGIVAMVLLTGLFVFSQSMMKNWSWNDVVRSQKIGDNIVVLLQDYHRVNGFYPNSLEEILSDMENEDNRPVAGTRVWHYSVSHDRQQCRIEVRAYGRFAYERTWSDSINGFAWDIDQ